MKSAIINFSGHALCIETKDIFQERYGNLIDTVPYDFDFSGEVEPQIQEMIKGVSCKLDGRFR